VRGNVNILLFGANGQVGHELRLALAPFGNLTALGRADGDLEKPVRDLIAKVRPDVIVNAAAYTAVDKAESEPERAMRVNAGAVAEMAQAAAQLGTLLVHYSTDYVFDGHKVGSYVESDATGPLSAYGRSKLAGEEAIRMTPGCTHLIFRTSWVYALHGKNFAHTILQRACTMDRLPVVADTHGVPTNAELISDVTAHAIRVARPDKLGTYHLVPSGETTWYEYAVVLIEAAREAGMPIRVRRENIVPVPASAFAAPAARPLNSRLDNGLLCRTFGLEMPDWKVHVCKFAVAAARNSG
jgi:dTDP-4-dehydrorhamnose reductase